MKLLTVALASATGLLSGAEIEFNRDIRPIFSDRCFACHGPDTGNRKANFRLDQETAAKADLGKGRFGLVAGDPARSEIFKRITSTSKALRMPPSYAGHNKLPDAEIERIRTWIEQGARYQQHWSLIAPKRPTPPTPSDKGWAASPIDAFVLARLEREGLRPSPEASRSVLLRRLSLDLTGIPPTPDEVDTFVNDTDPRAYEKQVDRLLASPRYSERMAIRWLEAARYSDTNGYQTDGPRDMWRWRDWVIDAFRSNMPFDQFTIEQIAGDLLPNPTVSQRVATGFHRNHRTSAEGGIVDEEFRLEYVADRAETTSTVWLGMTMGCARCHDHKYDPILQKDFYQMMAFFNNVPEKGFVYNFGNEEPYIKAPLPDQQRRLEAFDARVDSLAKKVAEQEPALQKAQAKWERRLAGDSRSPLHWSLVDGLIHREAADRPIQFAGDSTDVVPQGGKDSPKIDYLDAYTLSAWVKPDTLKGTIVQRGEDYFEGHQHALYIYEGKLRMHQTFRWTDLGMRLESALPLKQGTWQHVTVTYDGSMKASHVRMYVDGAPVETRVLFGQPIWPLDVKGPWRIGQGSGLAFRGGLRDVRVYRRELSPREVATLPLEQSINELAAIPAAQRTQAQSDKLRSCFLEGRAPKPILEARRELAAAQMERKTFYATIPTVMVMEEMPKPRVTHVLKRGAYDNPGDPVSAETPSFLPPLPDGAPKNRLGLARWLVDRNNPLTARVTVNRYWQMIFGMGLVKTVEDFGSQGEWPIHLELLDWLAVEFMDSGWNVKSILKTIVMSNTYRQSSRVSPDLQQRDPDNRLLARGARTRLPAEMVRDQALAVSGLLVDKLGGPSVRPYQPPGLWQELQGGKGYESDHGDGLYRRSLYTYWKRTVAPPSMVNFDSPSREVCIVRESRTNTPLQALNLMNDVAYLEAARKLAERMLTQGGPTDSARLAFGMKVALARPAQPQETVVLSAALEKFHNYYAANPQAAGEFLKQGESPIPARVDQVDLATYASVASLILNLDEMVTKE